MSPDDTFVWLNEANRACREHLKQYRSVSLNTQIFNKSTTTLALFLQDVWGMSSLRMRPGTGAATELWKTSKLIHAPLVIKSRHSRTCHVTFWLWWTHLWCPPTLASSRRIWSAQNVPKRIQNNQTPEAAWKPLSPGYGMFAVRALASSCHIKRLAYFGSHQALHQKEISRVWLVPVSEVYV